MMQVPSFASSNTPVLARDCIGGFFAERHLFFSLLLSLLFVFFSSFVCRRKMRIAAIAVCCLAAAALHLASADLYLHFPPGSNNRLNEQTANNQRTNGNRLFDSQNNARGGYNIGEWCPNPPATSTNVDDPGYGAPTACDGGATGNGQQAANLATGTADGSQPQVGRYRFYDGSFLPIEWTQQHSCGTNPNVECNLVIQYNCVPDPNLVNSGVATNVPQYGGSRFSMTDGNNQNAAASSDRGRQEPDAYYAKCQARARNAGLFTADQTVTNNAGATATRQNPNGNNQHGNECPEERDYYPYWHPTTWRDAAVLTSNTARCPYYQANSFNVVSYGECVSSTGKGNTATQCWANNNPTTCQNTAGCTWTATSQQQAYDSATPFFSSLNAPDCQQAPYGRDNYLGNSDNATPPSYQWTVPSAARSCGTSSCQCALRMRYNISSTDLSGLTASQIPASVTAAGGVSQDFFFIDSSLNGNSVVTMPDGSYYGDNTQNKTIPLTFNTNTNQLSRVFQDRTHLFYIQSRPAGVDPAANIFNVGVRGRRGNIVQSFPAVEYDFVPQNLNISQNDFVQFQWTGSNTQPTGSAGQGNTDNDRNNLLVLSNLGGNFPAAVDDAVNAFQAGTPAMITNLATAGRGQNINNQMQDAPAYYRNSLVKLNPGTRHFTSTRNNNFTNRSQKLTINVAA